MEMNGCRSDVGNVQYEEPKACAVSEVSGGKLAFFETCNDSAKHSSQRRH